MYDKIHYNKKNNNKKREKKLVYNTKCEKNFIETPYSTF